MFLKPLKLSKVLLYVSGIVLLVLLSLLIPQKSASSHENEVIESSYSSYFLRSRLIVPENKLIPYEDNLNILALAIRAHEGFYLGSVAYDNNNPGNLRNWNTAIGYSRGFAVFETYEIGWRALQDLLLNKCEANPTLYELISVYAPASDNNNPYQYASILADKLNITIDTRISDIYCI